VSALAGAWPVTWNLRWAGVSLSGPEKFIPVPAGRYNAGMTRAALAALLALGLAACSATERDRAAVSFRGATAFDVLTETPAGGRGAAALLFSGGYAADLDWTVPGSVPLPEGDARLTVNGEPTADGAAIARALVSAGFRVTRFSTIDRAQLGAGISPALASPLAYADSLELARTVYERFARRNEGRRLYLVAFSLGAPRAALVADERVRGVVLLSPAYFSRTAEPPARLSSAAADRAGVAGPVPLAEWPGPAPDDLDGDGLIRGWEIVAADPPPPTPPPDELPEWPVERLARLGVPTLALFGGLDGTAVHGPAISELPAASVRYLPALGHTLGPQTPGARWPLTGPIDPGVVDQIARWLDETDRAIARREAE